MNLSLSPAALTECVNLAGVEVRRGVRISFEACTHHSPYTTSYGRVTATVTAVAHQNGETFVELWAPVYFGTHARWFRVQGRGHSLRSMYRSRHDGSFCETWSKCELTRIVEAAPASA